MDERKCGCKSGIRGKDCFDYHPNGGLVKEIEAVAEEIVNNFKGATVDHFGCCLMQEQIVKALTQTLLEALEEAAKVVDEFKMDTLDSTKEKLRFFRWLKEKIAEAIRTLAKKEEGKDNGR